MHSTKRIALVMLIAVSVLIVAGFIVYSSSFGKINLKFINKDSGVVVDIYKLDKKDLSKKLIKTIDSPGLIELRKGNYQLISGGDNNFEAKKINFVVSSKIIDVTVDPNYSEMKLQSLLHNSLVSIKKAMNTQYPRISSDYTISKSKLFKKGEWYSALLVSNESGLNSDTLRIVLRKKSGEWVTVTTPPQIVINSHDYPGIPKVVVDSTNKTN